MAKNKKFNSGLLKTAIIVLCLVLAAVAVWKSYEFIGDFLFYKNEHLVVQDVIPNQTVLWKDQSDRLAEYLEIEKGKTNIFEVDLSKGRRHLEDQPDIEKAIVARELPDTIIVTIKDRTPRAIVEFSVPGSKGRSRDWLPLDINGVVMSKESVEGRKDSFPKIVGCKIKEKIELGKVLGAVVPAMKIVKLVLSTVPGSEFGDTPANKPFTVLVGRHKKLTLLKVEYISLAKKGVIKFTVALRGITLKKPFVVTMNDDNKIAKNFARMRTMIIDLVSKRASERHINLTFDGVTPIKK